MVEITKSITVDVAKLNTFKAIVAKQGDVSSRFLKVQLTNEGTPIVVSNSSVVTINALRSDNEASAFLGQVNEDGSVTVPLTGWMLEIDGELKCSISIVGDQEDKLTSTSFIVTVEYAEYLGENIEEDENYNLLVELLSEVSTYKAEELERVAAEQGRVSAETLRQTAETSRQTAEQGRVSAETSRQSAEESRVSAEEDRESQETTREDNESIRSSGEESRVSAETSRQTAEQGRVSAENTRVSKENSRESAETTRTQNETSRTNAETLRQTAETSRQTAEQGRVSAEQNRVAAWANAAGINQIIIKDKDTEQLYGYQFIVKDNHIGIEISEITN